MSCQITSLEAKLEHMYILGKGTIIKNKQTNKKQLKFRLIFFQRNALTKEMAIKINWYLYLFKEIQTTEIHNCPLIHILHSHELLQSLWDTG